MDPEVSLTTLPLLQLGKRCGLTACWGHSGQFRACFPQACGHWIGDTAWGKGRTFTEHLGKPCRIDKTGSNVITRSWGRRGGIFVAGILTIRATANRFFFPSPFRTLYPGPFFFHPKDTLANQTEPCATGKVQRNKRRGRGHVAAGYTACPVVSSRGCSAPPPTATPDHAFSPAG